MLKQVDPSFQACFPLSPATPSMAPLNNMVASLHSLTSLLPQPVSHPLQLSEFLAAMKGQNDTIRSLVDQNREVLSALREENKADRALIRELVSKLVPGSLPVAKPGPAVAALKSKPAKQLKELKELKQDHNISSLVVPRPMHQPQAQPQSQPQRRVPGQPSVSQRCIMWIQIILSGIRYDSADPDQQDTPFLPLIAHSSQVEMKRSTVVVFFPTEMAKRSAVISESSSFSNAEMWKEFLRSQAMYSYTPSSADYRTANERMPGKQFVRVVGKNGKVPDNVRNAMFFVPLSVLSNVASEYSEKAVISLEKKKPKQKKKQQTQNINLVKDSQIDWEGFKRGLPALVLPDVNRNLPLDYFWQQTQANVVSKKKRKRVEDDEESEEDVEEDDEEEEEEKPIVSFKRRGKDVREAVKQKR
jgi:hypothetical protein